MKKWFNLLVFLPLCSTIQLNAADYQEGVHYNKIGDTQFLRQNDQIEVVQFFWYGCPVCYTAASPTEDLKKSLPEDVNFMYIAAPSNSNSSPWTIHAKLFNALDQMGIEDKLHMKIFNAYHRDGKRFMKLEDMKTLVAEAGFDADEFEQYYQNDMMQIRLDSASALIKGYQLPGVPAFVVGRRYKVSAADVPAAEIANVTKFLIEKVRLEKKQG